MINTRTRKRGRPTLRTKERPILDSDYIPVPESGCWIWLGSLNTNGYGDVSPCKATEGRSRLAHRLSYEQANGPIPDGLELDHLCRVRCCINPDHLEPVVKQVNILRGEGLGARSARKTHCVHGHPLSGSNLKIRTQRTNGRIHRDCLACDRIPRRRRRRSTSVVNIAA
jgi:hypothetical protein